MRCTHTWGGYMCDGEEVGLLCYVVRGEQIPRVDFSCDRFMGYHYNHGGIIVLVAWAIPGDKIPAIWLRENRGLFQEEVASKVRPTQKKNEIIASAMKNYDALVEKVEHEKA